jgi:hypothetical protein
MYATISLLISINYLKDQRLTFNALLRMLRQGLIFYQKQYNSDLT